MIARLTPLFVTLLLVSAVPAQDSRSALRNAALEGNLPRVKQLLQKAPGVMRTPKGSGVLCMAAFSGNRDLVVYLLSQGGKVNSTDTDGSTPLYHAANGGHLPVVQLLLARGAKVNQARRDGWTPLHAAVASGERPIVELLLAKGANVNAQAGLRKETPFQVAMKYRFDDIAALLQKRAKK